MSPESPSTHPVADPAADLDFKQFLRAAPDLDELPVSRSADLPRPVDLAPNGAIDPV